MQKNSNNKKPLSIGKNMFQNEDIQLYKHFHQLTNSFQNFIVANIGNHINIIDIDKWSIFNVIHNNYKFCNFVIWELNGQSVISYYDKNFIIITNLLGEIIFKYPISKIKVNKIYFYSFDSNLVAIIEDKDQKLQVLFLQHKKIDDRIFFQPYIYKYKNNLKYNFQQKPLIYHNDKQLVIAIYNSMGKMDILYFNIDNDDVSI